jgi:hypothetical protein
MANGANQFGFALGRNMGPHLEPRKRQEIIDQTGHALGLLKHDAEEAGSGRLVMRVRVPAWFR